VRQCIIQSNTADIAGGGVFCNAASPSFTDCQFLMNTATSGTGGGLDSYASSEVTLIRCRFEGNVSFAGGALQSSSSALTARDCDFVANTVEGSEANGAAIFASSSGGNNQLLDLARCRFIGNAAISNPGNTSIGGALFVGNNTPGSIVNCQFTGNTADEAGAVQISPSPNVDLAILNCTIVGNTAADKTGGLGLREAEDVSITNCILWGNTDPGGMDSSAQIAALGDPTVSWSIVQGGWGGPGSNNIDADPLFVDADGADDTIGTQDDDVRLSSGSPAIDSGNSVAHLAILGPVDLAGNHRLIDDANTADSGVSIFGLTIDMGTYEFSSPVLPGDLDGDGDVDLGDYLLFQTSFTGPLP
jgi:hypothetical protein